MEMKIPSSSFWARHIQNWNKEVQDSILTSITEDKKTLGKKFPTVRKQCMHFTNAFTQPILAAADDDEIANSVGLLRQRLETISRRDPPINNLPLANNAPQDPIELLSLPDAGSTNDRIPRKPTVASYTDDDIILTKLRMIGAGWNETSQMLTLGKISSDMEYVLACSTTKSRNAALHSVLITEGEKHASSTDFLRRLVDFPDFDTAEWPC
ncbi:hypothetical protein HJC23_001649 [Cyclotella cryptica]|uniref:Uncharacterized protein n=1 Tax=Cyclotella cryptica TaxID=29204 RepID=A0ABD3QKZ9_9STRA